MSMERMRNANGTAFEKSAGYPAFTMYGNAMAFLINMENAL